MPPHLLDAQGQGFFITFEGLDGSGKTTQLQKTAQWLEAKGYPVQSTRQPGGTLIGEKIRALLLDPQHTHLSAQTELLLYLADRVQHIQEFILPAQQQGHVVLCDRFHDATIAYQGHGRQGDLTPIQSIVQEWILPACPNLTLLLEIPPQTALQRKREGGYDRIEKESLSFFQRIEAGYRTLVEREPERFVCVDGSRSVGEVHEAIITALQQRLGL